MMQQEYEHELEKIISDLDSKGDFNAENELNNLNNYKPIRLEWYVAQEKNQYKFLKNGEEVFEKLSGKALYLFDYKGIFSCLDLFQQVSKDYQNFFDEQRFVYLKKAMNNDFSYRVYVDEKCTELAKNTKDYDTDFEVYCELYRISDFVAYRIHQSARRVKFPATQPVWEPSWVDQEVNYGMLISALEKEKIPFVIIESNDNSCVAKLLKEDLQVLGKQVFYLKQPLQCEGDGIRIEDTVPVSIDSMENDGCAIYFTPVQLFFSNGSSIDNRDYLLRYINETYNDGKLLLVLAVGQDMDDFCTRYNAHKCMSPLIEQYGINSRNFALAWYGNYLDYISKIYGENCEKLINLQSTKRFSIVIPARNSVATLRYTLQTCLEQTYTGDYEIIVSDNSTRHNADVYELCKEINDPRIVYIKTPRDLHLPKSFEFAYLHAKGEYVFALGSDDGLLPWALEALNDVISAYPNEEIIQWERGFYAWPGFNGGQQHQFSIPRDYKKWDYGLGYRNNIDYIAAVLNDPRAMYGLPMLYINSCFKRSYFHTLMEKTGRLWDGICQDIYMGVVTACIHDKILNMQYPLTIAGMSSGSVGANANTAQKTNKEFDDMMKEAYTDNNLGGYCETYYERLVPYTGTDTCSLYRMLLRVVSIGLLPEAYLTQVFDWRKMFMNLACELDARDVAYDRKIHEMRYDAMYQGEDFLAWFDEAIYEPALRPRILDEEKIERRHAQRTYNVGKTETGGLMLDASEYGVTNIYEAVKLFERLSGLG